MPAVPSPLSAPAPSDAALRDADIAALLHEGRAAEGFVLLLDRYETKVFRLCMSMLRDSAQAQDAAQDTFLRVWRSLGRYDVRAGAFSTWIYAIARNCCLSKLGRARSRSLSLSDSDVWQQAVQMPQATPVNDAASLAWLRALVEALPAAYRSSLTLFYFEDRSVSEVAALLGLPEGTVKTHLRRARNALHQALEQHGLADARLWL